MASVISSIPTVTPAKIDLDMRAGATFSLEFDSNYDDGSPVDLATADLHAEIRALDGRLLGTFGMFAVDALDSGRVAILMPQATVTSMFEDFREFFPARWEGKAQFPGTLLSQSSLTFAAGAVRIVDRATVSGVAA